jgi:hypothetical protein
MKKDTCPFCGGFLAFEIGYESYSTGMKRVRSEDRIYCIMCARYRYLTEYEGHPSPKGRREALPSSVLRLVPPEMRKRSQHAEKVEQGYGQAEAQAGTAIPSERYNQGNIESY